VGRLAGFRYREVAAALKRRGLVHERTRGSHETWVDPVTGRSAILPRQSGDLPEGTLRSILRQAGIDPDDFLA